MVCGHSRSVILKNPVYLLTSIIWGGGGHHVYKSVWMPVLGEVLTLSTKEGSFRARFGTLRHGGRSTCEITGKTGSEGHLLNVTSVGLSPKGIAVALVTANNPQSVPPFCFCVSVIVLQRQLKMCTTCVCMCM